MNLREFFGLREATPFSAQASYSVNTMGQAQLGNQAGSRDSLRKVEELLRQVLVSETGGPPAARIINKFLVDMAPYMDDR